MQLSLSQVNLYIGSNGPQLVRLLDEEFKHELAVRQGIDRRRVLPFDKPAPAEIERNQRLDATAYAERRAEEERREAAIRAIRERAYQQISEALRATTVVLFLPPSVEAGRLPDVADDLKDQWAKMGIEVVREEAVIINEEMADEIFYERRLPQHSLLVEVLQSGYSIAVMLKKVRPGEGEEDRGGQGDVPPAEDEQPVGDAYPIDVGMIEKAVAETVYGFVPGEESDEEEVEEEEEEEYSTEDEEEEEWESPQVSDAALRRNQPKEMRPLAGSPAALLIRRLSETRVNIPGIYAPFTANSKSAAVRVVFPAVAEPFYELEELPPEPPPSVVVVFDASKREEVVEISSEYTEVAKMGFFNDKKERLVNTLEEYNKLRRVGAKDKIVLSVVRTTSAPLLALAAAGPTYISPNKAIAKEDERVYFGAENIADPMRAETPPEQEEEELPAHPLPRRVPVLTEDDELDEEDWEEEEDPQDLMEVRQETSQIVQPT